MSSPVFCEAPPRPRSGEGRRSLLQNESAGLHLEPRQRALLHKAHGNREAQRQAQLLRHPCSKRRSGPVPCAPSSVALPPAGVPMVLFHTRIVGGGGDNQGTRKGLDHAADELESRGEEVTLTPLPLRPVACETARQVQCGSTETGRGVIVTSGLSMIGKRSRRFGIRQGLAHVARLQDVPAEEPEGADLSELGRSLGDSAGAGSVCPRCGLRPTRVPSPSRPH